jgi:hypothetical protein
MMNWFDISNPHLENRNTPKTAKDCAIFNIWKNKIFAPAVQAAKHMAALSD